MREDFELKFDDDSTEKVSVENEGKIPLSPDPNNEKSTVESITSSGQKIVEVSDESAFKVGAGIIFSVIGIIVLTSILSTVFGSSGKHAANSSKNVTTKQTQSKNQGVFEKKAKKDAQTKSTNIQEYQVKSGDTLYEIAINFNVKMHDIADLNKLEQPYTLKTGQKLLIPASQTIENP